MYGGPPRSPQSNNQQNQYPQSYQQQSHNLQAPQPPAFLNVNHNNRGVYTSMIQPTQNPSFSSGGGLSKLQSMGRAIKEDPEPTIKINQPNNNNAFQNRPNNNTLSFRHPAEHKPKMSASFIFPRQEEETHQTFQNSAVHQGTGTSKLQALMTRGRAATQEEITETPEEKRKRQIESIKSELGKLNKKMENFNFRKQPQDNSTQGKQYFQLSRKPPGQPPTQQGDHNQQFFKTYAGGSSSSSSTTSGSTGRNYAQLHSPQHPPTYLRQQQQTHQLQNQVQHSLSSNELGKRLQPQSNEGGGMFKKKSPYAMDPSTQEQQPARKFMLSPKSNNNNNNMVHQQRPSPVQVPEYRAAEIVQVPSQPKKGMKRVDSTEKPYTEQPQKNTEPKKFQKSDFIVGKKLGKGQFGEVMLVIHKETGFLCGMKVMSKKQIVQQKYVAQVARQLSIQFYLTHRNVSPLYGYFQDKQNVYLLVQFATDGQLLQLLRKAHRMEEKDCSPIIRQICQGLDYIHKEQIIHRDVKPENILFNFDTVKICDFGWAVFSGSGMRKTVAGSPLYYSPEVVLQSKYDEKIDVWAIGMMAYECLLGKIPFRIYSQLDLNRIVQDQIKFPEYVDVSDEAKDFILRICKKNPQERMDMRDIMRHPFITKYLNVRKVGPEVMQDFKKVLNN